MAPRGLCNQAQNQLVSYGTARWTDGSNIYTGPGRSLPRVCTSAKCMHILQYMIKWFNMLTPYCVVSKLDPHAGGLGSVKITNYTMVTYLLVQVWPLHLLILYHRNDDRWISRDFAASFKGISLGCRSSEIRRRIFRELESQEATLCLFSKPIRP